MDDDFLVTVQDSRKLGFCVRAQKPWFAQHGLDFKVYVRKGLPAGVLRATNDRYAEDVIAQAKKRIENGQ